MSGNLPDEALCGLVTSGADDFLAKPFKPGEFVSRVRALLLRRAPQAVTIAGKATLRIPAAGTVRTPTPSAPPSRPAASAEALSLMASRLLVEASLASDGHWGRIVRFVRAIAGACSDQGEYGRLKDDAYLELLAAVAPVYDVGLLILPRNILLKQEKLELEEKTILQTHTTVGFDVLTTVAGKLAAELPSMPLAAEVARSHHEHWDGSGYPDQLAGPEIPLSARVISLASVYEALRSRRPQRPALAHAWAVKLITQESPGEFDPILLAAFTSAAARLEQIHLGG
jgi:response regulator RpfG family c-di-GMP phosphodiesterase